jgi:hypothetical protein
MSIDDGSQLRDFFSQEWAAAQGTFSETPEEIRVDGANGLAPDFLVQVRALKHYLTEHALGILEIHGQFQSSPFNLATVEHTDIEDEPVRVIVKKCSTPEWRYFLSIAGFEGWLARLGADKDQPPSRQCVWIAQPVEAFSTYLFAVKSFGSDKALPKVAVLPEKPWKLVRDLTHKKTPISMAPWLLVEDPPLGSCAAYDAWRIQAAKQLAFCLPAEVRTGDGELEALFKGGRTIPLKIEEITYTLTDYLLFSEACHWVYGTPREAETKFLLLNNHIAVNWELGQSWPGGARKVLSNSLIGAKEAFAFHLLDQSKEAVKGLGDLRKGLQEEVAKTQTSSRDLISAVWRDFAIAGVLLALKTPGMVALESSVIRPIYLATALLLLLSVLMSGWSACHFNRLADLSRKDWRNKLYSFLSDSDWQQLVESQIHAGRAAFWRTWSICLLLYTMISIYMIGVAFPDVYPATLEVLAYLGNFGYNALSHAPIWVM